MLCLAGDPNPDAADCTAVILPELKDSFKEHLGVGSSARAADKLKELFQSVLTAALGLPLSVNNLFTLEPDNITIRIHSLITLL